MNKKESSLEEKIDLEDALFNAKRTTKNNFDECVILMEKLAEKDKEIEELEERLDVKEKERDEWWGKADKPDDIYFKKEFVYKLQAEIEELKKKNDDNWKGCNDCELKYLEEINNLKAELEEFYE